MHKGVLVARSKFLLLLFSGYCCCCFFCCVLDPIHYIFFALFFAVAASHYTILFICLFIYLVSLSSLKGWLSPGDKQVRFDSPPTLPSEAPLLVSRTKKRTFPEEKKIRLDLFFCHLITSFVSSPFCCRCFWFRYCSCSLDLAKFPCKIVLENPRVISQEFSENSFALICTKILKNIKKW